MLLIAAYAGLSSLHLDTHINDKVLHFITFFLLTIVFYWIVDTNRRRTLNLTLTVCTLVLGVGSEFLQSIIPNGRTFDILDIAANVLGSLSGLGLCTWYHQRMLERRRARRQYNVVPGEEDGDLELGDGHESGVVHGNEDPPRTLEDEVDNWDENAMDDWDDGDEAADIAARDGIGKGGDSADIGDATKRGD